MQNNTISTIMSNVSTEEVAYKPTVWSEEDIIARYKALQSDTLYDRDEISTVVCSDIIEIMATETESQGKQLTDVAACLMIYNIFDICKKYVVRQNVLYDAQKMLDRDAQKSTDYLRGLMAPR